MPYEYYTSQRAFVRLAKIYSEGLRRPIFFVGSGASKVAGIPTWEQFTNELCDELSDHLRACGEEAKLKTLIAEIDATTDMWGAVQLLKDNIPQARYEARVRDTLRPNKKFIPKFYIDIWRLKIKGLITLNLDGLALQGAHQAGNPNMPTLAIGKDAHRSKYILTDSNPFIVEVHGNISNSDSWILTRKDLDSLTSVEGYKQFMRTLYATNLFIYYGIGISDLGVTGQLDFLNRVGFANGDYFWIVKEDALEKSCSEVSRANLPIQVISIPRDVSWEDGVEDFLKALQHFRSKDEEYLPVLDSEASIGSLKSLTKERLRALPPNDIRKYLSRIGNAFQSGDEFNFDAFRAFCLENDDSIHLSSRVNIDSGNNRWLEYTIVDEIGRGNFGKVYKAKNCEGEQFAIKVAHEEVRGDRLMLNNFRRGISAMRSLDKEHVEGVVSVVSATELPPSLIMPFVDGINLETAILHDCINGFYDVMFVLSFVVSILVRCHNSQSAVFHRDLRPQNVMLNGEWYVDIKACRVILLDFDLAWHSGANCDEHILGDTKALGYLSPEQLNPNSKYSPRSALVDVFGVGMLMYYLLSRRHPVANLASSRDWSRYLQDASSRCFENSWKSLPKIVSDLIRNCTLPEQIERPGMEIVKSAIDDLYRISTGKYPVSPRIILTELAERLFGSGFAVESGAVRSTGFSKNKYVLEVDTVFNCIRSDFRMTIDGAEDRTKIGKGLQSVYTKSKLIIEKIGRLSPKSGIKQGGLILLFEFDIPTDEKSLASMYSALDDLRSKMHLD